MSDKRKNLERAVQEATRFLTAAKSALSEMNKPEGLPYGPHVAAAKRASMDLTRALALIRRTNQ